MASEFAEPVLITGATGFIGSHLALRLVRAGVRPRILVRDETRLRSDLRGCTEIIPGALTDRRALSLAARGAGTVFHCAGNVATWDRWDAYRAANVEGTRALMEAIDESASPSRLVHLSTADVYGFPKMPCDESCDTDGGTFGYGVSKAQGELLLRERAGALGIPWVVLRPCNVVGPYSPFIRRIGDELRAGIMLKVDRGRANFGFLYVENLIDVMLWAARAPQAVNQIFNVRDPTDITWARFLGDLRRGIRGRGIVVSLPLVLADAVSTVFEMPQHYFGWRGEPLLHALLVRTFGRTCGHVITRIERAGAPLGRVGYAEAMERSIAWYRAEVAK